MSGLKTIIVLLLLLKQGHSECGGENSTNPYHAVSKHAQEHFIRKKKRKYLNVKEGMLYALFFQENL